jgi:hypothetical protein
MPIDPEDGKTYPELTSLPTPVVGTDVIAAYREPGPLKRLPTSALLDYIELGVEPLVTAAEDARDAAITAQSGAETAETNAETAEAGSVAAAAAAAADAVLAQQYAGEAANARLTAGFYPEARSDVPRGITSTGITAGSGYTNGTYDIATTGGSLTTQGEIRVVVSGGAITSATILGTGLYIGASPSDPTVSIAGLGAGTGGAVTASLGFLIGAGEYYWTDDATSANLMALYQNVANVATASSPLVNLTKTLTAAVVPCTVSAPSARSYPMTPTAGFAVTGTGANQLFFGIAGATNAEGQLGTVVTATIAGVFSGAATEIVLPNGNSLPAAAITLNSPFIIQPAATRGKYVLISPAFSTQMTYVQLEWVSGTGNAIVGKMPFSETKLPANQQNIRYVIQVQGDKPAGSPSLTVRNFANTADLIATQAIYDKTDTTALTAAGLWSSKQWIEVIKAASGRFNIVEFPSVALTTATQQDAALALQLPTVDEPVFAQKLTDRTWLVELQAIQYDDTNLATSKKMNQDTHYVVVYDMGRAMSQGALTNAYAPAINSHKAFIGGKDYLYSWLYSDEIGGGAFDGDQPSTAEFAIKVGLYGDATSSYDFYGLGHGLMQMVSSSLTISGGATDYKAYPAGIRLRGTSFVWTTVYDIYRPPVGAPTRIGQATIVQTLDDTGVTVQHTHKVGRTMAYTSGSSQSAEGSTITGLTSGATCVVVVFPAATTGTFGGGTAAGDIYVKSVTGTFQSGETLSVSGSPIGTLNGLPGDQIGVADSFSAMLPTTSITGMKVATYPAITIGYELASGDPNYQRPNVVTDGISTWAGQAQMQVYQQVNDPDVILEMILLGAFPFNPPGDYSLCATTQMFAQDREGGNRKMYANWVSGVKQVYEGTYTGQQRYQFRVGALV